MTKQEFSERLSRITDQSTGSAPLSDNKKFHGLINLDRFRLKNNLFIIKGEIKETDEALVVNLEIVGGTVRTMRPTFIFLMLTVFAVSFIKSEDWDYRYIPFMIILVTIVLWVISVIRQQELDEIQETLLAITR